jgi:hypothetical protein
VYHHLVVYTSLKGGSCVIAFFVVSMLGTLSEYVA